jgi:hypothetical protein
MSDRESGEEQQDGQARGKLFLLSGVHNIVKIPTDPHHRF